MNLIYQKWIKKRSNCLPRKMLMKYNCSNCSDPNYSYTLVCKLICIRVSMIKKDIHWNHILIRHAWSDNYVISIRICWLTNCISISLALYTTKKPTNHSLFIFIDWSANTMIAKLVPKCPLKCEDVFKWVYSWLRIGKVDFTINQ